MSSPSSSRIDSLRIKAKLLQKAKKRAGKPIALKEAFALLARSSGYASWREMKSTLAEHELLRPPHASALWNIWYATHEEAVRHLGQCEGYLLPYQKQFFICDDDYLRSLGLQPDDPDVVSVGHDWTQPRNALAWQRLLGKLSRKSSTPQV